jgi:hypothetical protein
MLPLRIVETDRPDFDEPVVELWREDDFVGMIFWDGEEALVQIYLDDDGDVYDIEIGDLLRVLDMALRIVTPTDRLSEEEDGYLEEYNAEVPEGEWDEESPATSALTSEFDERVVFRADDGEGFFDRDTVLELIDRCAELGLAVIEMECYERTGSRLEVRPDLGIYIDAPPGMAWTVRAAAANAQTRGALDAWPDNSALLASLVVQQPDGESFIA